MTDRHCWIWNGRIVAAIAVLDSGPADCPPTEAEEAVQAAISALLAAQQRIVAAAVTKEAVVVDCESGGACCGKADCPLHMRGVR